MWRLSPLLLLLIGSGCSESSDAPDPGPSADSGDVLLPDGDGFPDAAVDAETVDPDASVHDALPDQAQPEDAPSDGALPDATVDGGPRYLNELLSLSELELLSGEEGDVKYLAPIEGLARTPPLLSDCYFQNMNITPWHLVFLAGFEETSELTFDEYVSYVLVRDTRKWWGGSVEYSTSLSHPFHGTPPVLLYTLYAEATEESALTFDEVVEVDGILRKCAPFAENILAFMPSDAMQVILVTEHSSDFAAAGIAVVRP